MRSSVEQECFRLIQQIAVTQHPFCVRCDQPATCGHHIYTRSRPATAFLPDAVLGVCAECHEWIERNPEEAIALAISIIGRKRYEMLEWLSYTVCRFRKQDYRDIRQELRIRLREGDQADRVAPERLLSGQLSAS